MVQGKARLIFINDIDWQRWEWGKEKGERKGFCMLCVYACQRITVRLFFNLACDFTTGLGSGDREELSSCDLQLSLPLLSNGLFHLQLHALTDNGPSYFLYSFSPNLRGVSSLGFTFALTHL